MNIEIKFGAVTPLTGIRTKTPKDDDSNDIFAELLNQKVKKTESHLICQEDKKTNKYAEDIATIKEKGMIAYLKELDAKKREEIREEILEAMGITEEDLTNMPQEQRASIEKMISEEIQKRFAAMAMMDKENEESDGRPTIEPIIPGMGIGFAFLPAIEDTGNSDPFAITQEHEDG